VPKRGYRLRGDVVDGEANLTRASPR
jgi:hypothetical protein